MKKFVIYIICIFVAFLTAFLNVFGMTDQMVEDVLYHHAGTVDGNIRIIKIDDRTMKELGNFAEWDRSVYAKLLETLCVSDEIRPAVVGFDILFTGEKDIESDRRFAEICEEYGHVVTGASYVFSKKLVGDEEGTLLIDPMYIQEKVAAYDALKSVTREGFVNALIDPDDGVIRSAFLYMDETEGTRSKSFCSAVYEEYMEVIGKEPTYPVHEETFRFRYSGTASDYENVSLIDVLNGTLPAQTFDDCIVLVGSYAPAMMDSYFVPVDRGQQMYGVEIHANIIQAIMDGKILYDLPGWMNGMIAAVCTLAMLLLCRKQSVVKTVLICAGVVLIKLGAGMWLFDRGYSLENLTVPVFAVLIAICYVALHYYRERKAKQSIERAFNKYVAPQVVKEIAKSGTYELKLGGENRDIAVLFVDIRGFTPLSESLAPEQVVDILNGYLALTTRCIFRHGGTLDKFIGDATMAVFNAPFDTEDYVYKALLAAWDIVQGGNRIEAEYVERYGKHVGFGVGVNCGPAVVGNIGCDFRMDYTAIGDTVNTAARLESNAPRGKVYISDAVYEKIKDRITVEHIGEIPLKGKSKGIYVYSVTEVNGYRSPEI